jgi:hypothetical protein
LGEKKSLFFIFLVQTSTLQERLDVGLTSQELSDHFGGIVRTALLQNHLAEAIAVFSRHSAVGLEPGFSIGVEKLGSEVTLVGARIVNDK